MKFAKNDGFTLVELIVVIAILAILAGAAVPAYSGYIERAEIAADQALVSAVNTAFASAVVDNGNEIFAVKNAEFATDTMSIDNVALTNNAAVNQADYQAAFDRYFSDNKDAEFQSGLGVMYDALRHMFVLLAPGESVAMSYGGGFIYVSAEDVQKLADSTFGTKITAQDLMNQVNDVSKFAAVLDSSAFASVFSDIDYMKTFLEAQGVNTSGMSDEAIGVAWEEKLGVIAEQRYNQMIAGKELTDEQKEEYAQAASDYVLSNSAILFAANNAKNSGDIIGLLTEKREDGKSSMDVLADNMAADSGVGLSQAAMAYGLYTAYAHSTGNSELIAQTKNNYYGVLESLDDPGFQAYLKTEQAQTDLDGYLSAMEMINSSAKDPDAVSSVLINDFNDPELVAALNQMMGK